MNHCPDSEAEALWPVHTHSDVCTLIFWAHSLCSVHTLHHTHTHICTLLCAVSVSSVHSFFCAHIFVCAEILVCARSDLCTVSICCAHKLTLVSAHTYSMKLNVVKAPPRSRSSPQDCWGRFFGIENRKVISPLPWAFSGGKSVELFFPTNSVP